MKLDSRRLKKSLRETAKKYAFRYTRLGAPRYSFNLEPAQLAAIIREMDRLKNVRGAIIEIGVARGMTTRFMVEHLLSQGIADQEIIALDTFNSFVPEHLDYEADNRGKDKVAMSSFGYNDYQVWKQNFREYPFVKALQSDCAKFDYASVAPIKLVILDVDLYLPTRDALPKILDSLVDGGVILVDDVKDGEVYDGAYQAYMEFCGARGVKPEFVGTKCGVVRKNGGPS